jgi:hypothetical protein
MVGLVGGMNYVSVREEPANYLAKHGENIEWLLNIKLSDWIYSNYFITILAAQKERN